MFRFSTVANRVAVNNLAKRDITTIIMGPPGGGKGTISKKLVKDYNYYHISTGDLLRDQIRRGTPLGLEASKLMNEGKLVPDAVVVGMVMEEVKNNPGRDILLDGFPRTIGQANELDKNIKIDLALNLEVPFEDIVQRISSRWTHLASGRVYAYDYNPPKVEGKDDITGEDLIQRDDDKPEAVRKRLESYQNSTAPLIQHYQAQNVLHAYDGSNRPDLVEAGRRSDAIYEAVKVLLNDVHKKAEKL